MIKKVNRKLSLLMTLLLVIQLVLPAANTFAATTGTTGTMLPPSNLSVQMVTPDDIKLTWSSVFGASGYNVYGIIDGQLVLLGTSKTTAYAINDLPQGSYRYVVSTLNGTEESGPSAPVSVDIIYPAMAAPATLSFAIQNGNDILLSWGASQYAESYNVYEIKADGQAVLVTPATGLSYKLVNMPAGTYKYAISSVNSKYGESPLSTPVQVDLIHPTMTAPATFTYTVSNVNDVTLKWGAVTYAAGYKIYQIINGEKVLQGTVTGTSVTYTNLPAGDYTYEIHSYSDRFGESADYKQVSFTIGSVTMVPPGNFAYKIQNGNDIVLTWAAAANATNYTVYQIVYGQKVLKSTVTGTTVTYTNMPAGDYAYEIHSNSVKFGESADGSQLSFTLAPITMAPPANLIFNIQNLNDVVLTWDAVAYAGSYKIYQVINGQKILKSTVTGTTVTYANLPAGDYIYEVHSVSTRFGESAEGSQVSLTVGSAEMAPPVNLTYTIKNGNDIVLAWDAAANANSYKIYQLINGQKVLKSTVTGTTVTYANLPAGDYAYEVYSYSTRFGQSANSSPISVTLVHPIMTPPTNLVQKIISATQFSLSWDAALYATSYKVYQIIDGQKVLKSTVTGTSVTYSNMAPGDYTFEVHAVSARFGESPEGTQLTMTLNGQTMQEPINPTYTITSGNDITLKWTGVPYANSYKVYQIVYGEKVLKSTVTTLNVKYTNMPAGDYDYIIHSYSTLLGESPNGVELKFTLTWPDMTAPASLTYKTVNGNDVVLTWTTVPYATGYNVYELVDGQEVLKTSVTTLTTTIPKVPNGNHTYVVHSVSSRFGESPTGAQVALSLDVITMLPPTNLTSSITNGNDITLRWTGSTYATGYNVYQIINGEKVLKSTVTSVSAVFTNMPAGDYSFEVHSTSTRFGESPEGAQISVTLAQITMAPPANLTKTIANGNDITLKWSASTYANNYRIYQIVDGQKILKSTVTGTSVAYVNMPAGNYSYQVHSFSTRFGESPQASTVDFELVWPVVQPPSLKGDVFNANNITFSWPAVPWANEYRLYEIIGGNRQLIYKGTALTYKLYNLTEETHYYEMTAYSNRFGESAASNRLVEDIVYPVMQPPAATLTLLSPTSARISWDFVTYANGYNVYEIVYGQPVLLTKNLNNLSYTLNDLSYADHQYYVTSYSNSFGESEPSAIVIAKLIVDTEAPVTTADAPADWTNQNSVPVTLSATDNETGVANTYYSINDGNYVAGTSLNINNEGVAKVSFYSVDKVGNTETPQTIYVKTDRTAPVTTAGEIPAWSKDPVSVTLAAVDVQSGVAKTLYAIDDSAYVEGTSFTIANEGNHKVTFYSVDVAGNIEAAQTIYVKTDNTAPVTTTSEIPAWSKDPVTVTLRATDAQSGVAKTLYAIDGSAYIEGSSFTIAEEGNHKVTFYSVDVAGNIEVSKTIEVKIDKTAPVTTASDVPAWSKDPVTVALTAADTQSGVAKTLYSIDESAYLEGTSFTIADEGVHKVTFYSVDIAGNIEAGQSIEVKIDKTAPEVSIELLEEYKLGTALPLVYLAKDNLSGIADAKMTVFAPNQTTGKVVDNNTNILLDKPGVYKVIITVTDAAGLSTTIQKQFVVFIPAKIEVTPKVIKGNKGVFTVRVDLPKGYSTRGFDLNSATLNGVKALNNNKGYYNQAKKGQFKFERSQFNWIPPEITVTFRGYVNGNLVVGQTTVKVQSNKDDRDEKDDDHDDHHDDHDD